MLLSHVTLLMNKKVVNKVNDMQAITNKSSTNVFFGLVFLSEVVSLFLFLTNNKDDLSTTTVLALQFLFIALFAKTKVKKERMIFV